ncbi:MAG: putative peptidase [Verrucomicrobiales bacterium]|jgi:predicted peptidase
MTLSPDLIRSAFAALFLALPGFLFSQAEPAAGKQVELSLSAPNGIDVPYLLALPKGYGEEAGKKWPVILFLHGRGESNGPLSVVASWGPPRFAARGDDFPYIVISPQCPRETNWRDPEQQAGVLAVLDDTLKKYDADASRVYLTGLSMGGYGSWSLAAKQPKRFAAVAPICGGGSPEDAAILATLPIWAFHGDQDTAVPFERSVEMVEAIKKAGGEKILFTTMEEFGHNSWCAAYATPQLYHWFNKHSQESE